MTIPERKAFAAERLAYDLLDAAVLGGAGLFLLAGTVMLARHWTGALEKPLVPTMLCGVGLGLSVIAVALRRMVLHLPTMRSSPSRLLLFSLGVSAAILCFGFALVLPGTSVEGKAFFWFLILAEEAWGWARVLRSRQVKPPPRPVPHAGPIPPSRAIAGGVVASNIALPDATVAPAAEADEVPAEEVLQHLTRRKSIAGEEELVGWVRMPLAVGQRTGNVHVAFCPPFARIPKLVVEQIEGPEARIKTALLLPYGVRFDLKLAAAAFQSGSVLVHFSAKAPME